jgi:hypothetical protein
VRCWSAIAVSLPMTDNNPERSAAATNIPATCIAAVALVVLVLLLALSGPLRGFINVDEGIWNLTSSTHDNKQ